MRLFAAAATTILLALAVAVVVMGLIFSRHSEQGLSRELTRDALQLVANLHADGNDELALDAAPAEPRFELPDSGRYRQFSSGG